MGPDYWFGTDELGRDVLSRLIVSIRISLLIAFGAVVVSRLRAAKVEGR